MKKTLLIAFAATTLFSCKKSKDNEPLYEKPAFVNQTSNTTQRLTGIQFLNEKVGFIAGLAGTILKTTNGGESWEKKPIGTVRNLQSVSFSDENTGWVSGATGTIFKTVDGGNYWAAQTVPTTQTLNGIKFLDGNRGWAVGAQGLVFRTTDGGENWVKQENIDTSGMRAGTVARTLAAGANVNANTGVITAQTLNFIYAQDANNLFIIGNAGHVFKSSDAGNSWKWQNSGNVNALYGIHFPTPTVAYLCGANGTMLKTDGFGNFENATAEANTRSFRGVYFSSNTAGWAIGEHGYIFHTNDGGKYWGNEVVFESIYIFYACAFPKPDLGYFIGNNGTILKVQDIRR